MSHVGPLHALPIACTLTASAGMAQLERWRALDRDHALRIERTRTRLTVHDASDEDAVARLRELAAVERTCCAFVDWRIEDHPGDLRLVVTGTPEQLEALAVGSPT